jgi:EAL domain-containing protein (putative c-di-GMP-specific phosphodiesterase class I)
MIDDSGEIVPPNNYIHIAEQTGLIGAIDKKVLEMAVQKQKQLVEQGINIVLSINLSGNSISNPEIFELCTRLFTDNKIKAEQFIIEVTETQVVSNLESANNFITQLTAIGGKFALDDFGVGFSSMNYLKQLPVQYLKIDGEFIKNLPNSREDRLFVKAINEIGRGMNIITIAEFVENDEILDVLSTIGVDYAQGIGIGKPMPYLEFHQNKILGGDGLET